jgi:hypothetical protein
VAFGTTPCTGLGGGDAATFLKWVAYELGPVALDVVVAWLGWPGASEKAIATAADPATARQVGLLMAAIALPADGADALVAIRLACRLAEIERAEADLGRGLATRPVTVDADRLPGSRSPHHVVEHAASQPAAPVAGQDHGGVVLSDPIEPATSTDTQVRQAG